MLLLCAGDVLIERAVRQVLPDHLADRRHLVRQRERGAAGEEQVAVGVDAPAEVEVRAGEEAQVHVREHAELKDRNGDGLDALLEMDLAAGRRARDRVERVVGQQGDEPGVGTGLDRAVPRVRTTVAVRVRKRDVIAGRAVRLRVGDPRDRRLVRVDGQGVDLRAGRGEVDEEQVAEVGALLLEAGLRAIEGDVPVLVDAPVPLIAHDDGGKADQQGADQHQHQQRRDHRDAAVARPVGGRLAWVHSRRHVSSPSTTPGTG